MRIGLISVLLFFATAVVATPPTDKDIQVIFSHQHCDSLCRLFINNNGLKQLDVRVVNEAGKTLKSLSYPNMQSVAILQVEIVTYDLPKGNYILQLDGGAMRKSIPVKK